MQFKSLTEILSGLRVSGDTSLGKTTAPTATLDVAGNIVVTGTVDGVDVSTLPGLISAKADASITISAGSGLTGGGDLSANRTLTLGTPSTLTGATTNAATATSHTHEISLTAADVGASPTVHTHVEADITDLGNYLTVDTAQTITGTKTLDTNFILTPEQGELQFGTTDPIYLRVLPDNTLSFEGTNGQLFSISDSFSGTIFSVNDISGIPSIEVIDDGTVYLAEFSGNVLIGTDTDTGEKLQVTGSAKITEDLAVATDLLFVDSVDGSVGIGTNLPSDTLDVVGTASISGLLTLGNNLVIPDGGTVGSASAPSTISIDASGFVKIGDQTAGTYALSVKHPTATDGVLAYFDNGAGRSLGIGANTAGGYAFLGYGADEDIRIYSTGVVNVPATLQQGGTPVSVEGHTHTEADITDLGNYAVVGHSHAISDVTNLQSSLDGKVDENAAITAGTATKITYDAKGLVTAGTTLAASDIPNLDAGKITTGTFADLRISQSSVTQHQAALSITESQISDLGNYSVVGHTHTPSQVGLGNVLNVAQIPASEKGAANGVATLGGDSKIPSAQLPPIALGEVFVVADNTARDALTVQEGDIAKVTSTGITWIYDGTAWVEMTATSAVDSVNGFTGTVVLDTGDITEGTNLYYTTTRANSAIDARVTNAFVDALNVDADTVDGQHASAFALSGHNHTFDSLSNVTITTLASGELVKWNGTAWVNNTLAEAGIAAVSHTHTESDITDLGNYAVVGHSHAISDVTNLQTSLDGKVDENVAITAGTATKITYDAKGLVTAGASLAATDIPNLATSKITSGTFVDARIAQSNVTQHQAALSITESQISDLGNYLVSADINTLAELNAIVTDATLVDVSHTHTESDITDLGNYSVVGHTHTESDITDLGDYLEKSGGIVTGNVQLNNAADLVFYDHNSTFPTTAGQFIWDLNNDSAAIYAQQPQSDYIDFIFKITDNANNNDRFVFWLDSHTGAADDKYPIVAQGDGDVYLNMGGDGAGSPNLSSAALVVRDGSAFVGGTNEVWHAGNLTPLENGDHWTLNGTDLYYDGGRVGIGTNSPGNKLSVVTAPGADDVIPALGVNGGKLGVFNQGGLYGLIGGVLGNGDAFFQVQRIDGSTTVYDLLIQPSGGNVGIGTITPGHKLEVNGSFAATTKSFVIDHPTKENKKLRYGSLEGPENGVYIRGKIKGNVIALPEYWTGLVHEDSITVQLTAIGKGQNLFVEDIKDNKVHIANANPIRKEINCFYMIQAERKDVDKLEVEYGN